MNISATVHIIIN